MKILKVIVPFEPAYCIYKYPYFSPYWNYVTAFGPCFDCNDLRIGKGDYVFANVLLEGLSYEEGIVFAQVMSPFDMRTLEMVKAGCCPPGLVNTILEGGAG